jgi:hypothetical protein
VAGTVGGSLGRRWRGLCPNDSLGARVRFVHAAVQLVTRALAHAYKGHILLS